MIAEVAQQPVAQPPAGCRRRPVRAVAEDRSMSRSRTAPVAYADALLDELDTLEAAYLQLLAASAIDHHDDVPGVIGLPRCGWAASDPPL
jgi:hypothetical protein